VRTWMDAFEPNHREMKRQAAHAAHREEPGTDLSDGTRRHGWHVPDVARERPARTLKRPMGADPRSCYKGLIPFESVIRDFG